MPPYISHYDSIGKPVYADYPVPVPDVPTSPTSYLPNYQQQAEQQLAGATMNYGYVYTNAVGFDDSDLTNAGYFLEGRGVPSQLQLNGWQLRALLSDYARQSRQSVITECQQKFEQMSRDMDPMRMQLALHVPNARDPKTGRKFREADEE